MTAIIRREIMNTRIVKNIYWMEVKRDFRTYIYNGYLLNFVYFYLYHIIIIIIITITNINIFREYFAFGDPYAI